MKFLKKAVSALLAAVMAVTMLFAGSITASADLIGYGDATGYGDTMMYDATSQEIYLFGLSDFAFTMLDIAENQNDPHVYIASLGCFSKDNEKVFSFTFIYKSSGAYANPSYIRAYLHDPRWGFGFALNEEGTKAFEAVKDKIASYVFIVKYGDSDDVPFDELIDLYAVEAPFENKETTTVVGLSMLQFDVKNQTYTGKALTPDVSVSYMGKTLKKGTDYTLTYKNNKAIGTAEVTVTGKGNYYGTKKLTFKIVPKKTTLTAKKSDGKIKLQWNAVKGAEKYQIYYREKGESKYKKLTTVSTGKTSYSTSKLDKNKTYEFKIRSYAESGGKKVYSKYSKTVTVK